MKIKILKTLTTALISTVFLSFNQAYAIESKANNNELNKIINFDSISGTFFQIQNTGNKTKEFTGTFSFSKPNKFIWEYQKPFKQVIQSDGNKLYIYDKDLQQVTVKNADEAISASPIAVFLNDKSWTKYFTYNISTNSSNVKISPNQLDKLDKQLITNINQWIILKPRDKDSIYQYLTIGVLNYLPRILIFQDNLGNNGVIQINNLNSQKFSTEHFKFIMPKNIDVLNN